MKIGFIGLGNMGAPMAENLCLGGYEVYGFDIIKKNLEKVVIVKNIVNACKDMDIVITMLTDGKTLLNVTEKIIPKMKKGKILIDCSTVDVETALKVSDYCNKFGIHNIDAPVSGGIVGAKEGSLTFMAGGSNEAFLIAKPLFEIMGKKTVHCGRNGSGQSAKICNNMILGATMIATCESIALADKLGLNRNKLFDVVSTSSGFSWSMNVYCPSPGIGPKSPADNNYKPGFASELMLKDLGLAKQAAESVNANTPMGKLAFELYKKFVYQENGKGKDFSFILKKFEKDNS